MPSTTTRPARGMTRVARFESRSAWPLFAASLVWFICLTTAWVDQHPDPLVRHLTAVVLVAVWGWFVADYLARLYLSGPDRRHFFRTRIFDLFTIAVPVLRPFMILTVVWRLPVFRNGSPTRLRIRYGLTIILFALLYVYVNAYLVWAVEKGAPGANIVSFGDAVWWGFTTLSTVGYGDLMPVTVVGRTLAVALMGGGMVVVGVLAGTVVSAITDELRKLAVEAHKRAIEGPDAQDGAEDAADHP